ncbi:MAG: hypothetical protein P0120_06140 [Nitrospira sp.]|nr:hypothetical protein [Nitrospira sp.]
MRTLRYPTHIGSTFNFEDGHKQTVAVCIRVPGPAGDREQHVRTIGTMTADLLTLHNWLMMRGVTHVALESTGLYWKPVYYLFEDVFRCLSVNAAPMHNVPGRKTDAQDCAWTAQ